MSLHTAGTFGPLAQGPIVRGTLLLSGIAHEMAKHMAYVNGPVMMASIVRWVYGPRWLCLIEVFAHT